MTIFARLPMLIIGTLAVAAATSTFGGVTQPTATLTLTEFSSSLLTATYDGPSGPSAFTVMNTSPDHWTISFDSNTFDWDSEVFPIDWQ
jgi:hypothetical protein